ncbi:hypothetical protein WICPIJ_002560 [Wickerhamomyces pijperi]|uniref:Uncharacterized protein n=1 Tax=Wickerhamomyces pijperi TaxID=599730 RepID=A0A9P8Q9E8_WICPI|nr:hypothetical protein WICPIJ_002560 [Wickerhamomyces pijperi]
MIRSLGISSLSLIHRSCSRDHLDCWVSIFINVQLKFTISDKERHIEHVLNGLSKGSWINEVSEDIDWLIWRFFLEDCKAMSNLVWCLIDGVFIDISGRDRFSGCFSS